MRYIGDVHGKWADYIALTEGIEASVQVGDFGIGFGRETWKDAPHLAIEHRFIRGNHDNPAECKQHPNWIQDGTVEDDVMYVGGAYSIDRHYRTIGIDWWDDEQLSYEKFNDVICLYNNVQPRIMITHDAPESIVKSVLLPHIRSKTLFQNTTQMALDHMFELHKPDVWIFGHWHFNVDKVVLGTRFICLGELQYIDL